MPVSDRVALSGESNGGSPDDLIAGLFRPGAKSGFYHLLPFLPQSG
jgi:hypothetical protein